MEEYIYHNKKQLKCGYTTGTCAAAAAKAAAVMLFEGEVSPYVSITVPKGITLNLPVSDPELGTDYAVCAVAKDSGDDPDVTNHMKIFARVSLNRNTGIEITGGRGIGRVTKPGLICPPGSFAINPVPREMITAAVGGILEEYSYKGGAVVKLYIPGGEKAAEKTFNGRLGITGGLSILGTTGIVKPMSESALIETIHAEINQKQAQGMNYLVFTPGNYGESFIKEHYSHLSERTVLCSNFIGDTIDYAAYKGIKGFLLIGHIGKLVKLAGGIMNTHSRYADARMECMAAYAALAGVSRTTVRHIMECISTDEAVSILKREIPPELMEQFFTLLMQSIEKRLAFRSGKDLLSGAIVFSGEHGLLGMTKKAPELLQLIEQKGEEQ